MTGFRGEFDGPAAVAATTRLDSARYRGRLGAVPILARVRIRLEVAPLALVRLEVEGGAAFGGRAHLAAELWARGHNGLEGVLGAEHSPTH